MVNTYIISNNELSFLYIECKEKSFQYAVYYYEGGKKTKSIWYNNTNIIRLDDYNKEVTLKLFIRDGDDKLIEQRYLNEQSVFFENINVIKTMIHELEDTPKVKNIYTTEDKENYEKNLNLLWILSILKSSDTTYLLKICSIVKSWLKVFNNETLLASREALRRNERADAVIYFCLSVIATYQWDEGESIIKGLQLTLKNSNNINICNVFIALYEFENSDFDSYCQHIEYVKNNRDKNHNHYIFTPIKTVYTFNRSEKINSIKIKNNILNNTILIHDKNNKKDNEYIISLSCNRMYFDLYNKYILDTLDKYCQNYKVVIFFSDGEESYYREKLSSYPNVDFYTLRNIDSINIGPISSLLRYYYVYDLLIKYNLPVFVFDLDSIVVDDLSGFINLAYGYDISSRILKRGVLPWEKYTGGFTLFYPTEISIQLSLEIKYITESMVVNDYPQWWIDQNIIEGAIRQIKYQGMNIKIHNALNYRDNFIRMPVGETETKKYLLDELYHSSLSSFTKE